MSSQRFWNSSFKERWTLNIILVGKEETNKQRVSVQTCYPKIPIPCTKVGKEKKALKYHTLCVHMW